MFESQAVQRSVREIFSAQGEEDLNEFQTNRIVATLYGTVIGFAIALAVLVIFTIFNTQVEIPLHRDGGFVEWDESAALFPAHPCPNLPLDESMDCSAAAITSHRVQSLWVMFSNFWMITETMHVAWLLRLVSVLIATGIAATFYRALLIERFLEEGKSIRANIFKQNVDTYRVENLGTAPWMVLASIFAVSIFSYLMSTLMWFFIAPMFTGLDLNIVHVWMIVWIYGTVFGGGIAYLLVAAETLEMLLISMAAIFIGLSGVFILAQDLEWWQSAISRTSVDSASAILFTLVLPMFALVLTFLWVDLNIMIRHVILAYDPPNDAHLVHGTLRRINIAVYFSFFLIALVGIFPNTNNYPFFNNIHLFSAFVGLGIFVFVTKIVFTRTIARGRLPKQFALLSYVTFGIDVVAVLISKGLPALIGDNSESFLNNFVINTTALELWVMLSICVWMIALNATILELIDTKEEEAEKARLDKEIAAKIAMAIKRERS